MDNIKNFRDTGGYQISKTQMTAWGRIYRCSGLFRAKECDWNKMIELGITSVMDLRREKECIGLPVISPQSIEYANVVMHRHNPEFLLSDHMKNGGTMGEAYSIIALSNVDAIADELILLNKMLKKGNVAYFCYGGKDRTGILTAVIQYLLGVCPEDIIFDYQISYTHNFLCDDENQIVPDAYNREVFNMIDFSDAESMCTLLRMFDKRNYKKLLCENGLSNSLIEELKSQLIIDIK